jgi:hypothetical protein
MERIVSNIDADVLIGIVFRRSDMATQSTGGVDITPEREALQVRSLRASAGKSYAAHKHLPQDRATDRTQESLIVIQGRLAAQLFDVDDAPLYAVELSPGDCLVALAGGHAFTSLDDDTLFYEHKNGPYNGLLRDKTPLRSSHV